MCRHLDGRELETNEWAVGQARGGIFIFICGGEIAPRSVVGAVNKTHDRSESGKCHSRAGNLGTVTVFCCAVERAVERGTGSYMRVNGGWDLSGGVVLCWTSCPIAK